uniref:non-specific serine/threonine protein kinase n=1 Tax=Seriola dumerili TaxID=41447 RepID=A0A3B4TGZ2_SERDU
MGSRRTTPRSTSWNGGSSNGDDSGGTSRPGGCSYLSNVRPENRSTLCSVMAQLTEETQPAFQTTLKSKAVSENCNVKFSCVVTGYPAPQVNWYKDDMQLDRYCGLPKYEIFRNGQNHSLHIYNCTVEDAAIYQASAINSKGIVSCSGVLEVGEMNEFKIHQRYFAKLKQKAEHRRREAEGKENQEPLRTISPDRTQRKRRSTMEAFLSMPSSMEDESNEESPQAVAVGTEDRLQEATVEEVEEKPVTNGQVVNENGNNGGTYIYDSAQKIFTAHQPKTPFVKKKIKISNIAKVAKADTLGERVSEERKQIIGFNEIPKPVSKVISIAELLRSQIKALDLTLANSMSTIPVQTDFVQEPTTTASKTCQELRDDDRKCKLEVKTSIPGRKTEAIIDDTPATNIKVTLTTVRHQLSKTEPPAQALQKPLLIETTGPHGGASKYNKGVMDIGQENGTSSQVPSHCPVVSLTESENVKHKFLPSSSKDEVTNRPTSISNLSGTVSQGSGTLIKADGQESNITILEHAQDEPVRGKDMESTQKLTPEIKLNSRTERGITEINSTTRLDRYKMEELNTNNSSLQSVQKFPTQSVFSTDTQESTQDSSMVEEFSRRDSLTNPTLEASPLLKKRNCVSPIPSATPQELASGARRKILTPKAKPKEAAEATSPVDNQAQKKEVSTQSSKLSTSPQTSPVERRSPLLSRRKIASETQAPSQQLTEEISTLKTEGKPTEKDKHNPFKAPQVIRKIRGETFADTSGHLKLWCQFFNVLSDSTIKWYKNEEEIAQIKRNAGDETQVNLAIVQASCSDSGVYGCSITNEYGTDSTDTLLSTDILAGMSLREDLGVGEEIEMTPLIFSKGVADSGIWANKLFGRIMMQESHIGDGCSHKVWRAKVIYGLEPVFESGNTCIIKVRNPIAYGGKEESCLVERNLDIVKQECKIQNLAREYCKIFSAEARVIENFGPSLEVLPVYLMYRPANTVPYATVEADLTGVYQKYSVLDHTGRIDVRTGSVVEQKCCALQHWIFQWTNGNLLLTRLEGVDTKITNVGISVKSTGHQGLCVEGNPKVFEQFVSQHQCNYFCGLLGLRSLKVMDSLLTPTKAKGSRSPLLQRKMAAGSSSPQTGRKAAGSPRMPRKAEPEGRMTPTKQKAADAPKVVKMA